MATLVQSVQSHFQVMAHGLCLAQKTTLCEYGMCQRLVVSNFSGTWQIKIGLSLHKGKTTLCGCHKRPICSNVLISSVFLILTMPLLTFINP